MILEEVDVTVIPMLGVIRRKEQKKHHENNEGTSTLVDLGGFSFTFLILKILSTLTIYYS